MLDLKAVFECVDLLLSALTRDCLTPTDCLSLGVNHYINKSDESLSTKVNDLEVHEAYYICCIDCINACVQIANSCIDNTAEQLPVFSVCQENKIKTCLEFVVCLGMYPLLDPGVALPLSLRMESYDQYKCPTRCKDLKRIFKLKEILDCFLQLKDSKSHQLQRFINPNLFLGDLIAVLLQLSYGMNTFLALMDSEHLSSGKEIIQESRKIMWRVLLNLPRHIAMKELLVLQGGAHITNKIKGSVQLPFAPVWLRRACGRLLSRLLVHPVLGLQTGQTLGVRSLLFATTSLSPGLISSTGPITSIDPRRQPELAIAVANILTTPPEFLSSKKLSDVINVCSIEEYYQSISNQVLDLLRLENLNQLSPSDTKSDLITIARFGYLTGMITIHQLCKHSAQMGKKLLLWPLIGLLEKLCLTSETSMIELNDADVLNEPFDSTIGYLLASATELMQLLKYITDLLDCVNPSKFVLTEICKLSRPLFRLLVQVIQDESDSSIMLDRKPDQLKITLFQLLSRLIKIGPNSRLDRLSLVRSWINLPKSINFLKSDNQELDKYDQFESLLVSFPCKIGMIFRSDSKIQLINDKFENSTSSSNSVIPILFHVPYNCVILKDKSSQTITDWQNPFHIQTLIKLFDFMYPNHQLEDNSIESEKIGLHLKTLILNEKNKSESSLSVDNTLVSDLFLSLISDLNDLVFDLINQTKEIFIPHDTNQFSSSKNETIQMAITSSLLASAMLENLGDLVWPQEVPQAIDLFELTLNRYGTLFPHADNSEFQEFILDTLSQLLGILAFYINQLSDSSQNNNQIFKNRDHFARLLPCLTELDQIIKSHSTGISCSTVIELMHTIRASLATRGAIKLEQQNDSINSPGKSKNSISENSHLIKPVNSHSLIEIVADKSEGFEPINFKEPNDILLKQTFNELKDPLIPVQGHALITLTRLLESRDSRLIGYEDFLFKTLTNYLDHTDSYIYLNTIRCLSALGKIHTDRVLCILLENFTKTTNCINNNNNNNKSLSINYTIEYRLKLGEAIMHVLRYLGDIAPKYRSEVLNAFTVASKDAEPLVRAGSLSNIAEFIRLLKYAVEPVIYEIFSLIEFYLCHDVSPIVRKAAAYLARSLFMLESNMDGLPSWLSAEFLRDLHRLLSSRRRIESDESVCEQIEVALAELDRCTRNYVFVKLDSPSSLVKHIRILHP